MLSRRTTRALNSSKAIWRREHPLNKWESNAASLNLTFVDEVLAGFLWIIGKVLLTVVIVVGALVLNPTFDLVAQAMLWGRRLGGRRAIPYVTHAIGALVLVLALALSVGWDPSGSWAWIEDVVARFWYVLIFLSAIWLVTWLVVWISRQAKSGTVSRSGRWSTLSAGSGYHSREYWAAWLVCSAIVLLID